MSFYQVLSTIFGDVDVSDRRSRSGLTPVQRCDRAIERLADAVAANRVIQHQTTLSSALLKASSEAVVNLLNKSDKCCTESGSSERKDMP